MIIKTAVVTLTLGLAVAGNAFAWGVPSIPSLSASSGSSQADPDAFLEKSQKAEALINNSADSLFQAVASKTELETIQTLQKKLNEVTDDKEKNAIRKQITESEMATIQKQAKDNNAQIEAKKWDEKKKKHVSNAFYNLSLGSLQAAAMIPEGQSIASSISGNPVNAVRLATKLGAVTDSLKSMAGIVSNTGKVASAIKPLMSAAKIETTLPTSSTDKQKDATDEV